MMERTTVRLPVDLMTKARLKAAAEGRTLTSLIESGLRIVVADNPSGANGPRIFPRVSSVHVGLTNDFSIERLREIEEQDDLEYMERLRNGFQ